jgi:hypothetical protein
VFSLKIPFKPKNIEKLEGYGWCQDTDHYEGGKNGTARTWLHRGTEDTITKKCKSDNNCVGFAGPSKKNWWVLYTTTDCGGYAYCNETQWIHDSTKINHSGLLGNWNNARCYRKNTGGQRSLDAIEDDFNKSKWQLKIIGNIVHQDVSSDEVNKNNNN